MSKLVRYYLNRPPFCFGTSINVVYKIDINNNNLSSARNSCECVVFIFGDENIYIRTNA